MKIRRIYAENYKTYKNLDLDLGVTSDRPIILIGGGNGCGKTTLFDAIYHALYGLTIKNPKQFDELFNAGVKLEPDFRGGDIILQVDFSGMVFPTENLNGFSHDIYPDIFIQPTDGCNDSMFVFFNN